MKNILSLVAVAALTTGCATVFDGGSKNINISPMNGGKVKAKITGAMGTHNVTLPTIFNAKRSKEDLIVTITDKCYEETTYVVQSGVTMAFWGNVLFGVFGSTGTTVDNANGNMWTYDNSVLVPTAKKDACK